jgi:hypothetical protein
MKYFFYDFYYLNLFNDLPDSNLTINDKRLLIFFLLKLSKFLILLNPKILVKENKDFSDTSLSIVLILKNNGLN